MNSYKDNDGTVHVVAVVKKFDVLTRCSRRFVHMGIYKQTIVGDTRQLPWPEEPVTCLECIPLQEK